MPPVSAKHVPEEDTRSKTIHSQERVPTCIPGFDDLIEGGFKRKSINLVIGGPGSGKTIFAIQFLVGGIVRYDDPGLYITFEEKKDKLYDDMIEFGWDLAAMEKKNMFLFLDYNPEQVKKMLIEGSGMIEAMIEKYKIKRIVFDSITSFSLLYEGELQKKEAALALFDLINQWGCTALMTSQHRISKSEAISTAVDYESDSIIFMYHSKSEGIRNRAIEILKMRGTKIPNKTFSMDITTKGIHINKNQVINV